LSFIARVKDNSHLGGVLVSVLAIKPEAHGFKPSRGGGLLRAIKMRSMPSFRGEVKPEAPFCNILQHVKSMNKNTSQGQIHNFLHPFLLLATR
jgi:hypothetical protein